MPGGNPEGWPAVKPIFQAIAAKADGEPCCDWVGSGGAGHYVKMVHNGIEYGDMQLISESYDLLHTGLGIQDQELSEIYKAWNKTELDSYLIEITSQIFAYLDKDKVPLVNHILDVAAQKGTGKWTVIDALNQASPLTLIAQSVFARYLSALKDERVEASKVLQGPKNSPQIEKGPFIEAIRKGLYAAKIISYTQGFMLMRTASEAYKWHLNFGAVALMWRGGCIIRSAFLGKIKEAYKNNPDLKNLLLDPFFKNVIIENQSALREVISKAALIGITTPCMSAGLNFYDSYRRANLPANLIQAQRDFFGAHTYERIDAPRGTAFHTEWLIPLI
jgi:6-phosphogluconate dehydrogenase